MSKIEKLEAEIAALKQLYADDRQIWHLQAAESKREIRHMRKIIGGYRAEQTRRENRKNGKQLAAL